MFDLEDWENGFYYNWTDFTYSPVNWLLFGLSFQRTRLYQSNLEVERGLLLGGGFKRYEFNGSLHNLGWDDPYVILTFSVNFSNEKS